ncbi:MAG TPA: NUDIX domain-containing protein [Candidatus Acidoferrales bacterium]|nr:NUDIX domain-containing protein [Candidatus Acidoferrales bacterium]
MPKQSAGILLYRNISGRIEVFLVHPGGPFWAKKDYGVWSIPKGEFADSEVPLEAAKREFQEETSFPIEGTFSPLNPVKQPGGKTVYAWAVEGDIDAGAIRSNTFSIEWPIGSARTKSFPEIDRADWFDLEVAKIKILKGQSGLLEQLSRELPKRNR